MLFSIVNIFLFLDLLADVFEAHRRLLFDALGWV